MLERAQARPKTLVAFRLEGICVTIASQGDRSARHTADREATPSARCTSEGDRPPLCKKLKLLLVVVGQPPRAAAPLPSSSEGRTPTMCHPARAAPLSSHLPCTRTAAPPSRPHQHAHSICCKGMRCKGGAFKGSTRQQRCAVKAAAAARLAAVAAAAAGGGCPAGGSEAAPRGGSGGGSRRAGRRGDPCLEPSPSSHGTASVRTSLTDL